MLAHASASSPVALQRARRKTALPPAREGAHTVGVGTPTAERPGAAYSQDPPSHPRPPAATTLKKKRPESMPPTELMTGHSHGSRPRSPSLPQCFRHFLHFLVQSLSPRHIKQKVTRTFVGAWARWAAFATHPCYCYHCDREWWLVLGCSGKHSPQTSSCVTASRDSQCVHNMCRWYRMENKHLRLC
jgi:hypothetical protein